MSYRLTISVYFGGRPIEIGYYRNWDDENLLYEAVAIALLFSDCRSYEEAKRAVYAYWMPERKAVADSMTDEEREDSVREFERCSEMPIVIDLSSRCIYASHGAERPFITDARVCVTHLLSSSEARAELKKRTGRRVGRNINELNFYSILSDCYIPFDSLDREMILGLFRNYPELRRRLSTDIAEAVRLAAAA